MNYLCKEMKSQAIEFNLNNYKSLIDDMSNIHDLSIYNGKCGIILYLIELYKISRNNEIISEILEVGNDVLLIDFSIHIPTPISFLTGSIGIAYTLAKIFDLTKIPSYREKCIEIITESLMLLRRKNDLACEYLNGHAGIVVGLLKIKSIINHEIIVEFITFSTDYLINNAEMDSNGNFFWDYSIKNNKSLTGFSHGVSGIGYAFLLLYKVTSNINFFKIYQRAIRYEDTHFDANLSNWIDYRNFPRNQNEEMIFMNEADSGNLDFFIKKKQMMAWCHGAPGILMTRLKNQKKDYPIEYYKSLILSINTLSHPSKFSLCHGDIGNLICLLNAKVYEDEIDQKEITLYLSKIIEQFTICKKEFQIYNTTNNIKKHSLFLGQLGALYSTLILLKYCNGNVYDNILTPSIEDGEPQLDLKNNLSKNYLKLIRIKNYPRTYKIAENLKNKNNILNKQDKTDIRNMLNLELKLLKFRDGLSSASYIHFRKEFHLKKYQKYLYENNYEFKLMLSKNFTIISPTESFCTVSGKNSEDLFLALSHHTIKSIIINDFLKLLLDEVSNTISFKLLVEIVGSHIEPSSSQHIVVKIIADTIEKLIELSIVEVR